MENLNDLKIVVKKSQRLLQLWHGDIMILKCPAGLGFSPIGDKTKEGDGATPEGEYFLCGKNDKSRYYKSFLISYPNSKDAKKGLENGLIDLAACNEIVSCVQNKKRPPMVTALGGEICIHGHGAKSDWTVGCIAVENEAMDNLWELCPYGTHIIIEP